MKRSFRLTVLFLCLTSIIFTEIALNQEKKETDKKIEEVLQKITPELITIRQDIHMHPELGFQETRTAGIVEKYFKEFGLEVRTNIGRTGVVGILRGGKPGDVVGFRGDMDALPITEETGLPYASKGKITYDGRETGY